MDSLRIAYIISSESWGGLELNQVKNAFWMQEMGHHVWVFGIRKSRAENYCQENSIPFIPILPHAKYYDFSAAKRLASLLKEKRVQHVIFRDVRDMSVCSSIKFWFYRKLKIHYFMEMQLGVSKKNLLHTLRFKMIDTWSCPLNWLQIQVKEKTRFNTKKLVYIPSAVDRSSFLAEISKEKAREILSIPNDKLIFGLAGRFDIQKGQLLLLQALKKCNDPNITILFLGEQTKNEAEEYYASIIEFITENNLESSVFIRPFRKDIAVFYKAIDAFIMASKSESIGMVTIESLCSGTPVIGSNSGGTPEIIGENQFGLLFETQNSDDLARAMLQFKEENNRFQKNELQEATAHFDHHSVLKKVVKQLQTTP